jgi:hypothetical protein
LLKIRAMQPVAGLHVFPGFRASVLLAALCAPVLAFGQYENITGLVTITGTAAAQTRTGIQASGAVAPGFDVTYSGTSQKVSQIIVSSGTYVPVGDGVAITRRNGATPVYPTSNGEFTTSWNAYVSGPTTPVSGAGGARVVQGEYSATMDALFTSSNLYTGTENLFVNVDGSDANVVSDIERMDFVFEDGLAISTGQAFTVFERGRNGSGANGGFKVALITAIDGSLTPTAFGDTIISVAANSYGPISGVTPFQYDVYRNRVTGGSPPITPGLDYLANSRIGPQGIGGVLFKPADFGLSLGSTFYGYAVFGLDVSATNGAQLVDWLNPTYYPTNSPFTNDADLVATGAVVFVPIPEPSVSALAGLGLCLLIRFRRTRK